MYRCQNTHSYSGLLLIQPNRQKLFLGFHLLIFLTESKLSRHLICCQTDIHLKMNQHARTGVKCSLVSSYKASPSRFHKEELLPNMTSPIHPLCKFKGEFLWTYIGIFTVKRILNRYE